MILEKIDEKRLLIAFSLEDLKALNLTFKKLVIDELNSKNIIKKILFSKEKETNFFINNNDIKIEALPQKKGVFVLVTIISKDKNIKTYKIKEEYLPFIFYFKTLNNLLDCIKIMYSKKLYNFSNSVVLLDTHYYLIIRPKNNIKLKACLTISEFAVYLGKNKILLAKILENGKVLSKSSAIKNIGKHLSS